MRVNRITVTGLFGMFTHDIPLSVNDRLTIVHGPNGFGKTIILKMLNGLFNSRYTPLSSVPYTQFTITFDDGATLSVQQDTETTRSRRRQRHSLILTLKPKHGTATTGKIDVSTSPRDFPLHLVDEIVPQLHRTGPEEWHDMVSGRSLSLSDVFEEHGEVFPDSMRLQQNRVPDWFKQLRDSLTVRLIDTERLRSTRVTEYRHGGRQFEGPELAVIRYASDLGATIQKKLAQSADLSQSLDRTFPARLVQHASASEVPEAEIRNKLADLEKKRSRLHSTGLLDKDEDMNFQIAAHSLDQHTTRVLTVYVQDVETKLSVFDDIAAKIELFETLINGHFLYKRISINKQKGFAFAGMDGTPLLPADLSSGEQHEIVLLYELLFKVDSDSLILIDEPELSLHVNWQEQFLTDLHKITKLSPFDVLIATHSPQIIHDRWDLTVELKGPDNRRA